MGTHVSGCLVGWERRMGGNNSTERKPKGVAMGLLTYDQLRELADQYQVPSGDVMTAYERFKMLDINCDDYVTMDDFSETFYLASDVYVPTIYAHMLQNGKVSFHTFLDTVLKFHPSRPLEDRLSSVFEVLDTNGDEELNQSDIILMLQRLNTHVSREKLEIVALELTKVLPEESGNVVTRRAFISLLKDIPGIDNLVKVDFGVANESSTST